MPMYEYACDKCETEFETLVMNSDEEKDVECPKCESKEVEKLLSVPGKPKVMIGGGGACGEGPPCGASWCQR